MNRKKYINDTHYREGYKEGHKDGINVVLNTCNVHLNRLEKDINCLKEKLKNIEESEEE